MLYTLKRLGLYHIQNNYLMGGIRSEYEEYQYECGWRLGQWNLLSTENSKKLGGSKTDITSGLESVIMKGEYEKHHYMSLKAVHDLDFTGVERAVAAARKCVIDSLAHASLECSKNLYHALSQLQTLQEIEDFVSAWKLREADNVEAVLDKWKKQSQLSLSEFQYMEPILAQRAVLLQNAMLVERSDDLRQRLAIHLADIQLSTAKLARTEGWHHVGERCLRMLSRVENLSSVEARLKLEQAQLSWEKGDREVGRCILRSLLGDGTDKDTLLYSSALTLYGNWMVETRSENSQVKFVIPI
jgi:ataxia telangiectasia mutated family protein